MSCSRLLDSFPAELGYCLHLLLGFDAAKAAYGGRVTAIGGVGPLAVVEGDPAPDAGLRRRSGFPGVQRDAVVLRGPPEALDEDGAGIPGLPSIEILALARFNRSVQPGG